MFGHGERNCHIKTYCANCAGSHKTSDCSNPNVVKCANCNGTHKSTDPSCVSRNKFLEMREKSVKRTFHTHHKASHFGSEVIRHHHQQRQISLSSLTDFPSLPSRTQSQRQHAVQFSERAPQQINVWENVIQPSADLNPGIDNVPCNNNNNLFSVDELNALAMEMITNLSTCKTKVDQFKVIAHLATKFLYSKNK